MAISSYSSTPASNTTISGINIAEGCPPSGINDAIRQLMADVKSQKLDLYQTRGADVASAATLDLSAVTGEYVYVTGTTGITAITLADGKTCTTKFSGILTLTNSASLICPAGANYTTAVGDVITWRGEASGVVRAVGGIKANGQAFAVAAAATTFADSTFRIQDDGDATKQVAFQASGITTATTRTVTVPDKDGTMAMTSDIPAATVLYSHIAGCLPSISNVGATTAAITISAGQAASSANAAYIICAGYSWLVSNGNAINGYQGGATLPNSSTIHFFVCSGGSGTGSFASTSLTPTLPAGYNTYYRRIFSIKTTGAGALIPYTPIEINGGGMRAQLTTAVLDLNGNVTTTASLVALSSLPTGVKLKGCVRAISNTNSYAGFIIQSPDETDVAPTINGAGGYSGAPGWDAASTSVAQGIINLVKEVITDTSAQVRLRSTATINVNMVCFAFEDFRR